MRLYLLIPGILLALAGLVFTLQGLGIVGPVGSLMYRNATWIEDGLVTFVIGLVIAIAGVWKAPEDEQLTRSTWPGS